MSMIQVSGLRFAYPGSATPVFEDVSFQIDTGWRLGFIGRNGRGKTTFLKLLCGEYEYGGRITAPVTFDYFPYPVADAQRPAREVLAGVAPQAAEWELLRELSRLELREELLERPFETLSGGERTKLLLAALFLNEGRFLLIDEPTNHLDAHARELVSAYLRQKKGFILVSHDRRFLDGCVDHILSFNRSTIEVQSGSFSSWFENFERKQAFEAAQNEKLKKDIARLDTAARRASAWSDRVEASKYGDGSVDRGYIGHKSAKMMKRAKAIEARRRQAADRKAGLLKDEEKAETLKLRPMPARPGALVRLERVQIVYDGRAVCAPVSLCVRQGDRAVLDGGNGSGKSSLLRLLAGEPVPFSGEKSGMSGLVISYVPQDVSWLRGDLGAFARESGVEESLFKTILRKMGFERAQFEADMGGYSDGQKKKVMIAKSLCERAHLYLWDEPLNYIDLYSRLQIERLIQSFSPTMILVEHDRAFQQEIGTAWVDVRPAD